MAEAWRVAAAVGAAAATGAACYALGPRPKLPKLTWYDLELAVCRMPSAAPWVAATPEGGDATFFSVTKTMDELSLVVDAAHAPPATEDCQVEAGWAMFRLEGPLDFGLIGILARIATVLAAEGISIFAVSTYDTDYVLVKKGRRAAATAALRAAGYSF